MRYLIILILLVGCTKENDTQSLELNACTTRVSELNAQIRVQDTKRNCIDGMLATYDYNAKAWIYSKDGLRCTFGGRE